MNSKGEILLEQSGVVRSNCIDCLDRTNVTQVCSILCRCFNLKSNVLFSQRFFFFEITKNLIRYILVALHTNNILQINPINLMHQIFFCLKHGELHIIIRNKNSQWRKITHTHTDTPLALTPIRQYQLHENSPQTNKTRSTTNQAKSSWPKPAKPAKACGTGMCYKSYNVAHL